MIVSLFKMAFIIQYILYILNEFFSINAFD